MVKPYVSEEVLLDPEMRSNEVLDFERRLLGKIVGQDVSLKGTGPLAVVTQLAPIVNPATITDQASYRHSTRPAAGIRHVLVSGEFVVRDGDIVADARPGGPVRAEPR